MRKALTLGVIVATAIAMTVTSATTAGADGRSINLESYALGSIDGQDGWSATGAYDYGVVDPDDFGTFAGFGDRSFRISNAITSGSFGDWAFTTSTANEAGETSAVGDGLSGGVRQTHFTASFQIASAVPTAEQPGLQISLAPDRGDGARMSFLRIRDAAAGLAVDFADYRSGANEEGCTAGTNFVTTTVATGLSRSVPHTIRLEMSFVDGTENDVVEVYVDDALAHTGTSWEDYFRECESNPTRPVDSLIFQARSGGGTAPATLGYGFLIDNIDLHSSTLSSQTIVVDDANPDDWTIEQHTTCGSDATGSQAFVPGPGSPPAGTGSREFAVGDDGDSFEAFGNTGLDGVRLADLTTLSYSTYVSEESTGGGGQQATYVILRVDLDDDGDHDDSFFFEPAYQTGAYIGDPVPNQGAVAEDTWQTWDALAGGWWSFNDGFGGPPLHTLHQIAADHPDATIVNGTGAGLRVAAGCGGAAWQGFVGNADAVTVGVNGADTTWDFETQLLGSCPVAVTGSNPTVYTLLADCVTDVTVVVPQHTGGTVFDGDGNTITGVDPPAPDRFEGAIVQAQAGSNDVVVENLTVTASGLADACHDGADRLRGILFDGVGGTITNNEVIDLNQGTSGCQEGNAIEARNAPFDTTGPDVGVAISDNTVTGYQKTGILVNGSVAAVIDGNDVDGLGPVNHIARNGIQIGFGATARIFDNTVTGNDFTPKRTTACGVLIISADGVSASTKNGLGFVKAENDVSGNEMDYCVFGKGGGFEPVS